MTEQEILVKIKLDRLILISENQERLLSQILKALTSVDSTPQEPEKRSMENKNDND